MSVGTVGIASFAFAAGVATFFAPCSYPLLPGYVAYFIGEDGPDERPLRRRLGRAVVVSGYVLLGFGAVYGTLGGVVATLGSRALADIALVEPVVGTVLVVLGVGMALGRHDSIGTAVRLPERRRSRTGFVLFGTVYAVAAAGCTAPVLLGVVAASLQGGPTTTLLGLGGYAAGMASLMVAVTLLAALGRDAALRRLSMHTGPITRVAGGLLVFAGLAQIYLYVFDFDPLGGLRWLGLV